MFNALKVALVTSRLDIFYPYIVDISSKKFILRFSTFFCGDQNCNGIFISHEMKGLFGRSTTNQRRHISKNERRRGRIESSEKNNTSNRILSFLWWLKSFVKHSFITKINKAWYLYYNKQLSISLFVIPAFSLKLLHQS